MTECNSSYHMGAPPQLHLCLPDSMVLSTVITMLAQVEVALPCSLVVHCYPPTPQQGSSKSCSSPQTVHPTPFPPAYSPRPNSPTPLLTHPWSNRIALVMAVVAVTTPLICTPIMMQDTSANRAKTAPSAPRSACMTAVRAAKG